MSDPETTLETQVLVRSGIKVETNSKGMAQVKIAVYEGVTTEEMQRLKDLAILVYETTIRELGKRAEFQ